MEVFIQILLYALIIIMFSFELWLSILNYKARNDLIPASVDDVYDKLEYDKYLKYTMTNFKFDLWEKGTDLVLILVLLLSGFFLAIDRFTVNLVSDSILQVLLFLFMYFLLTFIVSIVFSAIRTFKIEEKYGFNKSSVSTFIKDKIKSLILTIVLGGGLIYGLLNLQENTGWAFFIYAWIFLSVIIVITNLVYTSLIVPLFNKLRPLEEGSLKTKIEDFAQTIGYEVSKISVMDASKRSSKLNAFFSGFGKAKRIVLYDTLIEKLSEEEIVAVLAHEIGHNKHKHILYNLIQSVLMIGIYALLLMLFLQTKIFSSAFGFDTLNIAFNLILFIIVLAPIAFLISFVTSNLSRKYEYQADKFVKEHYDAKSLISALKVLARENYSNLTPHPLYVKVFYSHPPISSRIDALNK